MGRNARHRPQPLCERDHLQRHQHQPERGADGRGPKTFAVSGGTTPAVSETSDHGTLQQNLAQIGTYTVGGDTFVLSSGNAATVTLGTGASQIRFVGASSVTLTAGTGQAVVIADTREPTRSSPAQAALT